MLDWHWILQRNPNILIFISAKQYNVANLVGQEIYKFSNNLSCLYMPIESTAHRNSLLSTLVYSIKRGIARHV